VPSGVFQSQSNFPHPASFGVCLVLLVAHSLGSMVRTLSKWTYRDVTDFLQQKGFSFFEDVESVGQAWMSFHDNGEPDRVIEIRVTRGFYKSKALKRIIRQSGIPEEEWLKWIGP
jgi:hypothetical protein